MDNIDNVAQTENICLNGVKYPAIYYNNLIVLLIMNSMRVSKFKSSPITGGGLFAREIIEIDDTYITIRKRKYPFTSLKSKSIPIRNIINISITKAGIGTNIHIESFSKAIIFGRGFSAGSTAEIRKLLLG